MKDGITAHNINVECYKRNKLLKNAIKMNKLHKPSTDFKNPHAVYVKIEDIRDIVVPESNKINIIFHLF